MAVWALLVGKIGLLVETDFFAVLSILSIFFRVACEAVAIGRAIARLAVDIALLANHIVWGEESWSTDFFANTVFEFVALAARTALILKPAVA